MLQEFQAVYQSHIPLRPDLSHTPVPAPAPGHALALALVVVFVVLLGMTASVSVFGLLPSGVL